MKFQEAHDRRTGSQQDNEGTVVVKIFLAEKGHTPRKGNIVRTIRLERCKVSEVEREVRQLIAGDDR